MRYAKELTLRLANRSGLLAEITSALWRKGVNIHAFSAEVDGRDGTLHLIVDKFTMAKRSRVESGWGGAEDMVLDFSKGSERARDRVPRQKRARSHPQSPAAFLGWGR